MLCQSKPLQDPPSDSASLSEMIAIHGSGNVFYFGDPVVDSSITGSGDGVKIGG